MSPSAPPPDTPPRRRYVPAVGPRLRKLLFVVFGLFALLAVNSVYLGGITAARVADRARCTRTGSTCYMFLLHLVLGVGDRRAGRGVRPGAHDATRATGRTGARCASGYALFAVALVLLATGIVLTRLEGVIEVKDPTVRARGLLGPRRRAARRGLAVRAAPPGRQAHPLAGRPRAGPPSPPSSPS